MLYQLFARSVCAGYFMGVNMNIFYDFDIYIGLVFLFLFSCAFNRCQEGYPNLFKIIAGLWFWYNSVWQYLSL
jgi:hypothetical protein